ncbi:MAG: hypothetical protein HY714_04260 [Candidatus Omnitrophica bacterium]|nr:hypothetical protein [Candidatus Omnitrophota bacterium]
MMRSGFRNLFIAAAIIFLSAPLHAQEKSLAPAPENLLRDTFYLSHAAKLEREVFEVEGFTLLMNPAPAWNSNFSVVTGFKNGLLTSHILKDVNSVDDARAYFQKNMVLHESHDVAIREVNLPMREGAGIKLYWIGNRAFRSKEDAEKSLEVVKKSVEDQGGDFQKAVRKAREISREPLPPKKEGKPARAELEEEFAFKALDWLGFTEYLYGPFYGEPSGEKILYQTTFEGTYRATNLDEKHFDASTGFWSHRLVFRGIRFVAGTTLDPYIEAVPALQTEGRDFASNLEVSAGLEWRPLIRNAFLQNYQPYGLPILDWLRNTRLFIAYTQKKNLKGKYDDEVKTHNLRAGIGLFKEWGVDLPSLDVIMGENPYFKKGDLFWGELFTEYIYNKTNFSSGDDFDGILSTVAFKIGVKWPRFPLPDNPVNEEFLVMPYFLFEDVRNNEHAFFFQNRYFFGWGVRFMPFRDYRFANNEWLFKTKIFIEYLHEAHYTKDKPVSEVPENDFRVGVNMSLNRF